MFIKFILIFVINCINGYYNNSNQLQDLGKIKLFNCKPCAHLLSVVIMQNSSPCIQTNQLLFKWPNKKIFNKCKIPIDIYSNNFLFNLESGNVYAKHQICFLRQNKYIIHYKFKCTKFDKWKRSSIIIRHKVFII